MTTYEAEKYKTLLGLNSDVLFEKIEHEGATVDSVYAVVQGDQLLFALKTFHYERHYLSEIYFLNYFADQVPTPKIIKTIELGQGIKPALLMTYFGW